MRVGIRAATDADADAASALVHASFHALAAGVWEAEAVATFVRESSPHGIRARLATAAYAAVAHTGDAIVGFLLMPRPALLGMLFVEPRHARQGVGRALWEAARAHVQDAFPDTVTVELNATPYAYAFYRALGFAAISSEYRFHGTRATRMACWLRARELRAEPHGRSGVDPSSADDQPPPGTDAKFSISGPGPLASATAERILRALPQWFGVETALLGYAADAGTFPNFVAIDGEDTLGFLTLREHNPDTVEVNCIAVVPGRHREGVGTALCDTAARWWQASGGRMMQVKTLGPSRANAHYARTRAFYAAQGFRPVEEFRELWPGYPCLLLVRPLCCGADP
jgi:GNAT superfamily N-acetyltransferase